MSELEAKVNRPETIDTLPYMVMVIDEQANMPIIEDALVNNAGLNAIFRNMTSLDQRERSELLRELVEMGSVEHVAGDEDSKFYSVAVVSRKIHPTDDNGEVMYFKHRPVRPTRIVVRRDGKIERR